MAATIREVAHEAGVSIKTVSRVLNDERYVGAATRARVEAAVAALGFRPNAAARSLAGRRVGEVALAGGFGDDDAHLSCEVTRGVRERCAEAGVRLVLLTGDPCAADVTDGVVLLPPASDAPALLAALAARSVRAVRVSPGAPVPGIASVLIDDARAAAELNRPRLALGHRRIAHLAGEPGSARADRRAAGTRAALEAAGILDPALFVPGAGFEEAMEAARSLLLRPDRPTAILAASDAGAAGALAAAAALGLPVPAGVSIAGFGDTPLSRQLTPALTTVREPLRELGRVAADLLLDRDADADERRILRYELVLRDSAVAPGG